MRIYTKAPSMGLDNIIRCLTSIRIFSKAYAQTNHLLLILHLLTTRILGKAKEAIALALICFLNKKNPRCLKTTRVFYIKSLAVTYFRMGYPILSSALSVFTSEFEMDSGGSHSLYPPDKLCALSGSVPFMKEI